MSDMNTPEPVAVTAQQPSSASPTQQPESAPAVERDPRPLHEAALALVDFVRGHRNAGDAEVELAIADIVNDDAVAKLLADRAEEDRKRQEASAKAALEAGKATEVATGSPVEPADNAAPTAPEAPQA